MFKMFGINILNVNITVDKYKTIFKIMLLHVIKLINFSFLPTSFFLNITENCDVHIIWQKLFELISIQHCFPNTYLLKIKENFVIG